MSGTNRQGRRLNSGTTSRARQERRRDLAAQALEKAAQDWWNAWYTDPNWSWAQSPFARGVTQEAVQERDSSEWTWTAERGWHNPHSVLREEPLEKGKGKSKEPLQKGKGKGKQPLEKGKGKSKDKGKGKQDEPHQPASSSSSAAPPSQPLPKGADTSFPPLRKAKAMPKVLSTGTGQALPKAKTGGSSSSTGDGQALPKAKPMPRPAATGDGQALPKAQTAGSSSSTGDGQALPKASDQMLGS